MSAAREFDREAGRVWAIQEWGYDAWQAYTPWWAMTLGQAMEWNWTWGCACMGGDMCCLLRQAQADRLKRAAHIVVKLLADHASVDTPVTL